MHKTRRLFSVFILLSFFFACQGLIFPQCAWAQTATPGKQVIIYLFWGDGCPHCAVARPYYESLQAIYPGLILREFEIYNHPENQKLYSQIAQKFDLTQSGVPAMFMGNYYLFGYADWVNSEIETAIQQCLQNGCPDAGEGIDGMPTLVPTATIETPHPSDTPTPFATSTPVFTSTPIPAQPTRSSPESLTSLNQAHALEIPLIGRVDLDMHSSTLSTALIAFVDGVNPCSLWVLSMLLALTIHTGSRKKVLFIGLIFLTVTAAIYALFIAGLFSLIKMISFLGWIQVVIALVALFFALVNIKDYFWYKEGISFTIAEDKKPGIFKRMRAVMDASQSLWGLASATVVLAAGVSVVEFSCTAGLPVLWVNLLIAQNTGTVTFILLLLLYMLIYQLDELVIFSTAVVSLKASRLEEKHGRLLKLISGMLMLTLAVVMLINPALMNNLGTSLLIFGATLLSTLLVLLLHRIILPRVGIRIGTEPGTVKLSRTIPGSNHRPEAR